LTRQVDYANALAARRGLAGRASFAIADGMAPPFGAGVFDVVVSIESAAYMPDKRWATSGVGAVGASGMKGRPKLPPGSALCQARCRRPRSGPLSPRCLRGLLQAHPHPLPPSPPPHPPSEFAAQLARVLAPGGALLFTDFVRADGPLTGRQAGCLSAIDAAFASAGNWESGEGYRRLFGEGAGGGAGACVCVGGGRLLWERMGARCHKRPCVLL
jgi:SAM-dependent methyltransferase